MTEQKKEPPKPIAPGIPVTSTGQVISEPVSPDWEKKLYNPERKSMLERGELNLRQYNGISDPEMMQLALVGFRMFENGKFRDAEALFTGLITLEPTQGYFFTALGSVYLAQENFEAAKVNFDQALALNVKDVDALVNRGEVHLYLGNIAEAAADFQKAIELNPKGKEPAIHRARLLARAALEMIEGQKGSSKDAGSNKPAAKDTKPAAKPVAKPPPPKAKVADTKKPVAKKK